MWNTDPSSNRNKYFDWIVDQQTGQPTNRQKIYNVSIKSVKNSGLVKTDVFFPSLQLCYFNSVNPTKNNLIKKEMRAWMETSLKRTCCRWDTDLMKRCLAN